MCETMSFAQPTGGICRPLFESKSANPKDVQNPIALHKAVAIRHNSCRFCSCTAENRVKRCRREQGHPMYFPAHSAKKPPRKIGAGNEAVSLYALSLCGGLCTAGGFGTGRASGFGFIGFAGRLCGLRFGRLRRIGLRGAGGIAEWQQTADI